MAAEAPTEDQGVGEAEELLAAAEPEKLTLTVKVYAPFQMYFEGEAHSVSAVNESGPFDILPNHRNFLCMLVPCELKVQPVSGAKKTVKIHRALLHVRSNHVTVFMDV